MLRIPEVLSTFSLLTRAWLAFFYWFFFWSHGRRCDGDRACEGDQGKRVPGGLVQSEVLSFFSFFFFFPFPSLRCYNSLPLSSLAGAESGIRARRDDREVKEAFFFSLFFLLPLFRSASSGLFPSSPAYENVTSNRKEN